MKQNQEDHKFEASLELLGKVWLQNKHIHKRSYLRWVSLFDECVDVRVNAYETLSNLSPFLQVFPTFPHFPRSFVPGGGRNKDTVGASLMAVHVGIIAGSAACPHSHLLLQLVQVPDSSFGMVGFNCVTMRMTFICPQGLSPNL